ncbi:hypothetical protein GCM10010924_06710 [Rhizobium wenxiniae]|nr:hypothetical protein GCM10010924_06710 [Rhizobium wenxiniae]
MPVAKSHKASAVEISTKMRIPRTAWSSILLNDEEVRLGNGFAEDISRLECDGSAIGSRASRDG